MTPQRRASRSTRLQQLAREALEELRSLILGLRPPELERDGLGGTLRKEVDDAQRAARRGDRARGRGARSRTAGDAARGRSAIAQEALHNALRHAGADRDAVSARTAIGGALVVEVTDDGGGFEPDDPELRSRHLGLTSMEERARELGGRLEIRSSPGAGTTVRLEVARCSRSAS